MSITVRGNNPRLYQDGLRKVFLDAYQEYGKQYLDMYDTMTSEKAAEEYQGVNGLGAAVKTGEGSEIVVDNYASAYGYTLNNDKFALAFRISEEAERDERYAEYAAFRSKGLGQSLMRAKNEEGAALFNESTTGRTYGDGQTMLSTDHPIAFGQTFSNTLVTPAALSVASLEALRVVMAKAVDQRGGRMPVKPRKVVVGPDNVNEIERIMGTKYNPDNANNAINVVSSSAYPEGYCVNNYFVDGGQFFVLTDVRDSLFVQERDAPEMRVVYEESKLSILHIGFERYAFGMTDPRSVYGSFV